MCSTCGCAEGERFIEGDEAPADDHRHEHGHHHHGDGGHVHDHIHAHGHTHGGSDHDGHAHNHAHGGSDHGGHIHNHVHHGHDAHSHAHRLVPIDAAGPLASSAAPAPVVHHHHYHGDVHYHFYNTGPEQVGYLPPPAGFRPQADARGNLDYGRGAAGTHAPGLSQRRMVEIEIDVLDKNNRLAARNRQDFLARHILALNLVSSPGSGKTTLLSETLLRLKDTVSCAVIEGDQQTTHDAERIRATGVPAIQVNTGKGCHLDAQMVRDAAERLAPAENSLLFIENVGNLVCPAGFDLGERCKVVVLSVTEGEDKPLKYPHMFAAAGLMILNKIDLLPWVRFDVDACIANARRVNPAIEVLMVSATGGEGMDTWLDWLEKQQCA